MARKLSIVIPAYNEERRILKTLQRLEEYFEGRDELLEVLVSDDGSTDRTREVVEEFAAEHPVVKLLPYEPNRGKGYVVRKGMLAARGSCVLFTDADLATPIEELEKFWPSFEDGADVVIASRALPGSEVVKYQPWYRKASGPILRFMLNFFGIAGIRDTQCGFKAFRREVVEPIFGRQTIEDFGFDLEVLYLSHRLGFRIDEVAVRWVDNEDSRVHFFRDSFRILRDMIVIRFKRYEIPQGVQPVRPRQCSAPRQP